MRALLTESLTGSMGRLRTYAKLVGHARADEFTFRSFFLTEIMKRDRSARCQTEWNKFDLLVQTKRRSAVVELKFYVHRRTFTLDGAGTWKGGPGPKNEGEFRACVKKLRGFCLPGITDRFLVLVYELGNPRNSTYSFERTYDDLRRFGLTRTVKIIDPRYKRVVCRLARIQPDASLGL